MGFTKKINLGGLLPGGMLIFFFLAAFPFGQIVRIGILQPLDLIVGLGGLYAVLAKLPRPKVFRHFENILPLLFFSWVFGYFLFGRNEIYYGFLYMVRLVSYFYFFVYVWNFARKSPKNRTLLVDSLLLVSVVSAVFGWIQFFAIPDIKPFFTWGWDMHLFRLVGTFLDPAFLSLIIVLGLLLSVVRAVNSGNKYLIGVAVFLSVSLAFTYSRAGYLALLVGLVAVALRKKIMKRVLLSMLLFFGLVLLLPTSKNHSIELARRFSAVARIENYQTTLKIFSKSPVFGVGYNNVCLAYRKYIGPQSFSSHSCSGSDSSILLILATTGAAGLTVFIYSALRIAGSLKRDLNFLLLSSSFSAVFVHSLFSNSLFYPWIMGWVLILLAVCRYSGSEA